MAGFTPSKKNSSNFNNGNKYVNGVDAPNADDFNNVIESQLYTQALATNRPDTTDAGKVGTPTVEIIPSANGTPQLKFSNLKGEKGEDGSDHSAEIAEIKTEQTEQNAKITKNANRVTALENALVKVGTIIKQNSTLVDEVQKTGGTQLDGFTVVDGSYATVKKIAGNTAKSNNLFNPDLLLGASGWTVTNDVYSGQTAQLISKYNQDMGGFLKVNDGEQVTVSFVGKNANAQINTLAIGFVYTDGTTAVQSFIDTTAYKKYSTTSSLGKKVDFIYFSYYSNDTIYLKDFCVSFGTNDTYEPYFQGLKSATFKGIKSTGRNLIPYPYYETTKTQNGVTFTIDYDGAVKIKGTAEKTFAFYLATYPEHPLPKGIYSFAPNNTCEYRAYYSSESGVTVSMGGGTVIATEPIYSIVLLLREGSSYDGTVYPMVSMGSTILPYELYIEDILELSQEVSLGKWDYVENGQVVRQTIFENYDSAKHNKDLGTYNGTTDFVISLDGLQVAYKGTTTYEPISIENEYLVWNNGTEQVITTKDGNGYSPFDYGANPTVENEYIVLLGGNE